MTVALLSQLASTPAAPALATLYLAVLGAVFLAARRGARRWARAAVAPGLSVRSVVVATASAIAAPVGAGAVAVPQHAGLLHAAGDAGQGGAAPVQRGGHRG